MSLEFHKYLFITKINKFVTKYIIYNINLNFIQSAGWT